MCASAWVHYVLRDLFNKFYTFWDMKDWLLDTTITEQFMPSFGLFSYFFLEWYAL